MPVGWLRRGAKELLARGGIRLVLPFFARNAHVLTFHGLIDGPPRYATENVGGKHISVDAFRRLVDWIRRYFRIVPLDDLVAALEGGSPLPPNSLVLTFDDGYESNYRHAYPILREYGLPATIFLATEFIEERKPLWTCRLEYAVGRTLCAVAEFRVGDTVIGGPLESDPQRLALVGELKKSLKATDQSRLDTYCAAIEEQLGTRLDLERDDEPSRQPLTWDEITEMRDSGLVSFGGHTHRHVILGRCLAAQVCDEVSACSGILRARLGDAQRTFAYPNGKPGDYSEATHKAVKEAGFSCALVTVEGPCVPGRTAAFGAPRLSANGDEEPWSLVGRILRRGQD